MSNIFKQFRIVPRGADFLNRTFGAIGEVAYDRDTKTLRLYDSNTQGGIPLAKSDLSNISNSDFSAKAASAGISASDGSSIAVGGSTSVTVGESLPVSPENGNLWLNTTNGALYVYIDDGDSEQWIQPSSPGFSGDYDDLTNKPATYTAIDGDPYIDGEYDFGSNRILYANVYNTVNDLPNASTYHGMFAHVHGTGKAYYAHAGAWVELVAQGDTINSTIVADDSAILVNVTNSTLSTYNLEQVSATNGQALLWNTSNNRWQPGDVAAGTGSFTFTGTTLDTDDSSSITITPATVFESDITVQNDLFADSVEVGKLTVTGEILSQGSGTPEIVSDNEINLVAGTTIVLNGLTTLYGSSEVMHTISGATGVVNHDLELSAVFYHVTPAADFTANFTNIPATNNRTISIALIINQGGTAYMPTAVQIGGASVTPEWQGGGGTPSGNANQTDIVSFTLIRYNSAWSVIGSLTTYA